MNERPTPLKVRRRVAGSTRGVRGSRDTHLKVHLNHSQVLEMRKRKRDFLARINYGLAATVVVLPLIAVLYFWKTYAAPSKGTLIFSFAYYQLTILSFTAGYHKFFAHNSFKVRYVAIAYVFAIFGTSIGLGSARWWAGLHRAHHRHTDDTERDPYSIKRGFLWAHWGWLLKKPKSNAFYEEFVEKEFASGADHSKSDVGGNEVFKTKESATALPNSTHGARSPTTELNDENGIIAQTSIENQISPSSSLIVPDSLTSPNSLANSESSDALEFTATNTRSIEQAMFPESSATDLDSGLTVITSAADSSADPTGSSIFSGMSGSATPEGISISQNLDGPSTTSVMTDAADEQSDLEDSTLDFLSAYPVKDHFNFTPLLQWQQRYYYPLFISTTFIIPIVAAIVLGESIVEFILFAGVFRMFVCQQQVLSVESVCHWKTPVTLPAQTFTDNNSSLDCTNPLVSILTFGQAYQNYHHEFPHDYRGSSSFWAYDPTKWFLAVLAAIGIVYDLGRTPRNLISQLKLQQQQRVLNRVKSSLNWGTPISKLPLVIPRDFKRLVAAPANRDKIFIVIQNVIHDITPFMEKHPGGAAVLKASHGKDATAAFFGGVYRHSAAASNLLATMRIGMLDVGNEEEVWGRVVKEEGGVEEGNLANSRTAEAA